MKKPTNQIQITDLLAEAVVTATERRNPGGMTEVSDADGKNVNGGGYISLKPYLINGFKELINISRVKAARW